MIFHDILCYAPLAESFVLQKTRIHVVSDILHTFVLSDYRRLMRLGAVEPS